MKCINQEIKDRYALYHGDSVEIIKELPTDSVGLSIFSPPFPEVYTYSDSPNDMGNSQSYDEFFSHFDFLIKELFRITKPGRNISFHCMDIPTQKHKHGYIGLYDFPGDLIKAFQKHGFIYHSRVTIWKDPLLAATRSHALGLLHKQLMKDSSKCRMGCADYMVTVQKPGENDSPIEHPAGFTEFIGENEPKRKGIKYSHETWQKYASPVWMDIRQSRTLQRTSAREDKDEKHICPLQLDVIERALVLWSNESDIVLDPFMGIGSTGYMSIQRGCRFVGVELKESYFKQSVANMKIASQSNGTLFD